MSIKTNAIVLAGIFVAILLLSAVTSFAAEDNIMDELEEVSGKIADAQVAADSLPTLQEERKEILCRWAVKELSKCYQKNIADCEEATVPVQALATDFGGYFDDLCIAGKVTQYAPVFGQPEDL